MHPSTQLVALSKRDGRSTHTHTLIIHDALAMMDVVADNPDDIDMEQIELEAHDLLFLDDGEMNVTHIPN